MSSLIYQLPTPIPATVGISPNFKFMVCGDDLAAITTPGYLNENNLQTFQVNSSDILQILYDYSSQSNSGTFGIFIVSTDLSTGLITLSSWGAAESVVLISTYFQENGSTTFTVPDNALYINYTIISGGGGGGGFVDGGGGNTFGAGAGGGAGTTVQGTWTIYDGPNKIPATSFNITINSGGAGGLGSASGGTGGSVVFTYPSALTSTTVVGGSGGAGSTGIANTGSLITAGGAGGNGIIGTGFGSIISGNPGLNGLSILGQVASGNGGGTVYRAGAISRVNSNGDGFIGAIAGAGGSGACGTSAGTLRGGSSGSGIVKFDIYGIRS